MRRSEFPRQVTLRSYREPGYPQGHELRQADLLEELAPSFKSRLLKPALGFLLSTSMGAGGCAPPVDAQPAAQGPAGNCPPVICPSQGREDAGSAPAAGDGSRGSCDQVADNPFSPPQGFQEYGLINGKGTGSSIGEEVAVSFLLAAFINEGVDLKPDHAFDQGGGKAELDGYDPGRRVGFEFVNHSDMQAATGYDSVTGKHLYGTNDGASLTYEEIKELDSMTTKGIQHVITISATDSRFSTGLVCTPDKGCITSSKEAALYRLAKHAHSYVQWLKQQGVL